MCLTLLGFGKGTISGCARIIHAICIGPKIVAGSLFSILQSLGGTLVGECGVTIAVFALLAIIGSLGWLLWEFALLPLFNYLSDADYNEIFKDFDDFVEDIESFATNQTRIISPKLSKFNEFARNGSADFVKWSANFVNQTGTRLTEIIDEGRRKMQEFDKSLENPVNI